MVSAFFAKYGVRIAVITFLLGIVAFFAWDYKTIKDDLVAKKAQVQLLSVTIEEQNEKITSMKIDVEAYKNKKPQLIEKIVTQYQEIQVKDETCEAKLDAIYEAQKVFFDAINKNQPNPFSKAQSKDIK